MNPPCTSPLISVIVPVYNAERWLGQSMNTLLQQSYKNLQIICIDDASTDQSFSLLQQVAALDSRVELIRLPENRGLSAARNMGLKHARGEWIAGLDSDDYLPPETYAHLISQLDDEADIVCFAATAVDEFGKKQKFNLLEIIFSGSQAPTDTLARCTAPMFQTKLWKRNFLQKWNLQFAESCIHEDEILWHQACAVAERIQFIQESLYFYRRHDQGIMGKKETATKKADDYCKVLKEVACFYHRHGLMQKHFRKLLHLTGTLLDRALKLSRHRVERGQVRALFQHVIRELELPNAALNAYPVREINHRLWRWNPFFQRAQGKKSICLLYFPIWTRKLRKNTIIWRLCGIPIFKKKLK